LTKNRAAVVDFFEDMLRARKFLFNPANHKEAVEIVSGFTKAPPERLDSWLFTKRDYYRDPDARVNVGVLQKNVDQLHQAGSIKQRLDVGKYVDHSYLDEAAKRLK
jgi:NitT/TauT family transport system substrate-binding protein